MQSNVVVIVPLRRPNVHKHRGKASVVNPPPRSVRTLRKSSQTTAAMVISVMPFAVHEGEGSDGCARQAASPLQDARAEYLDPELPVAPFR
jgi:hypothetical protein